jgi:hypothetical protein
MMQHHTIQAYQLMQSQNQMKTKNAKRLLSANENTKALLALLDGLHKAHGWICHRPTHFFLLIATSLCKAT